VVDFPTPKNKTQIRQFLGMSGYYARYIRQYAITAEPLTRALKGKNKKENVEWTEECDTAFHELKRKLTEKPVLYAPDFSKEFIVQTDASEKGIGVVLAQKSKDNTDHPILYLSKKFTESEKKFGTTEKECAAIIYAIKKLRHYLDGQHFTIETDHNPLVFLKTNAGNNPRLMRWALALQPFNYTIIHRAGKEIGHADCLSRMLS
jgi:phospholipid-translocating ATPase